MLPLVARGKSLGTLGVASVKPHQYGDTDVSFLREVATQIAMAVENMKAYASISALNAQVTEAAERSRALLEINNLMIGNLTQDALFRAIAHAVRGVIPFDRTAVCLHDPTRDVLRVAIVESSLPFNRFTVGMELAVAGTHIGHVFRSQKPLLRGDVEAEQEYASEQPNVTDGVHSQLVVPLIGRGTSIGTLSVSSTARRQYTTSDAIFLQEVANQVAMAIQNMKAYEEISMLKARLERENVYLQEEIGTEHNFGEMIGSSPALLEVMRKVERVAPTDATVLISGETGTGKELGAHAVHARSPRRGRPLVKVNCGAISAGLRPSGAFRADLFYRLNVFPIQAPPLRERVEEIPQLVTFFVGRFARRFANAAERVSSETMDRLVNHSWPGNVRELQNVVERAVVLASGPTLEIGPELLGTGKGAGREAVIASPPPEPGGRGLDDVLKDVETRHVRAALEQAGWVIEGARGAARILGLHPNTLRSRIEKLGIRRSDPRVS